PEAAALGLIPSTTPIDAWVGFGNSALFSYDLVNPPPPGRYDFFGTVAHEISEVMGRELGLEQPSPTSPTATFHWMHFIMRLRAFSIRSAGGTFQSMGALRPWTISTTLCPATPAIGPPLRAMTRF